MFRDPEKVLRPVEITEFTATRIIVDAIQDYLGGEALDSEADSNNPKTVQAMKDFEDLVEVLWTMHGRGKRYGDLVYALESRFQDLKSYIERQERQNNRKEAMAS